LNLIERMEATQKTVDRFKGREFKFGQFDCVQLAIGHSRHAGRKIKIPKYGDLMSGTRALRQVGFETLGAAMDRYFPRIEPARMLLGDFVEMPGMDGFSSLAIAVGNGRVLGFHESIPHADILQPILISGAWSIE
jgi:hypothetical protein